MASHCMVAPIVSFSAQARRVSQALDALEVGPYDVVAHDSGGLVARLLALLEARSCFHKRSSRTKCCDTYEDSSAELVRYPTRRSE